MDNRLLVEQLWIIGLFCKFRLDLFEFSFIAGLGKNDMCQCWDEEHRTGFHACIEVDVYCYTAPTVPNPDIFLEKSDFHIPE